MVRVYSKQEFDENLKGIPMYSEIVRENAFISITGNIDKEKHLLSDDISNVLNLRFDDVDADELDVWCYGENAGKITAKGISREQVKDIVDFVLRNKDKNFHVHCHAGISRSGAVGSFIVQLLDGDTREFFANHPHIHPQQRVLRMLKKEARNRGLL